MSYEIFGDWRDREERSSGGEGGSWHAQIAATLGGHDLPRAGGCGCGGNDACRPHEDPAPPVQDDAGTPGLVLLGRMNAVRAGWDARERARDEIVARDAEAPVYGRDAALELRRHRAPDGGTLSGSAAKQLIMELKPEW